MGPKVPKKKEVKVVAMGNPRPTEMQQVIREKRTVQDILTGAEGWEREPFWVESN